MKQGWLYNNPITMSPDRLKRQTFEMDLLSEKLWELVQ